MDKSILDERSRSISLYGGTFWCPVSECDCGRECDFCLEAWFCRKGLVFGVLDLLLSGLMSENSLTEL